MQQKYLLIIGIVFIVIRISLDIICLGRVKTKTNDDPKDKASSAFFAVFYNLFLIPGIFVEMYLGGHASYSLLMAIFAPVYFFSLFLRAWGLRTLKEQYSVHVRIYSDHELVKTGPYKYFKHPIYVASVIEMIALPLALSSYYVAIIGGVIWIPSIIRRIAIEEKCLREKFGEEYDKM